MDVQLHLDAVFVVLCGMFCPITDACLGREPMFCVPAFLHNLRFDFTLYSFDAKLPIGVLVLVPSMPWL